MLSKRVGTALSLAAIVVLVGGPASAQTRTPRPAPRTPVRSADGYVVAHHLGGSTSFHRPPLTNAASVKRMLAVKGMQADVRKLLGDAGIPETADAVVSMLSGASTTVKGGSCTDATPADGTLVECDFAPGATLEWMAYRPNIARGDR